MEVSINHCFVDNNLLSSSKTNGSFDNCCLTLHILGTWGRYLKIRGSFYQPMICVDKGQICFTETFRPDGPCNHSWKRYVYGILSCIAFLQLPFKWADLIVVTNWFILSWLKPFDFPWWDVVFSSLVLLFIIYHTTIKRKYQIEKKIWSMVKELQSHYFSHFYTKHTSLFNRTNMS